MGVVLQGSLRNFSASEVLLLLGARTHSGTFDAESGDARARLVFRAGRLVWAESGGLDVDEVVERLVSWREGSFAFKEEVEVPDGAKVLLDLDIGPLVAEAEARASEESRVLQLYPDDQIAFRVVNRPMTEGDISLRPDEFQILFQFAGGKSLAQLVQITGRPPIELYPIVQKLQSAGLIELDAKPEPAKKTKPGKPTGEKPQPIGTLTNDAGVMHPLLEEVSSIGRLEENDISLADGSVSSRHARVTRTAEGFVIEDVGSRNGTFVNSEKVAEKRLLVDGDLLRLGKVILIFNLAMPTRRTDTTQPELHK